MANSQLCSTGQVPTRSPAHAVSYRDLVGLGPTGSTNAVHFPHTPKLDYASFLYNNAAPTNPLTLDRIQYAGARIILGALKCSPNYLLEAEADLIPLAHRRDQMLLQYSTRVSTISRHPVTKLIQSYQPFQVLSLPNTSYLQ